MLADLVKQGAIEFQPEPLDDDIERRFKAIWTAHAFPNCDEDSLHALDDSTRIWMVAMTGRPRTHVETPFYDSELARKSSSSPFVYIDTLLSINQIAFLLSLCYKMLYD